VEKEEKKMEDREKADQIVLIKQPAAPKNEPGKQTNSPTGAVNQEADSVIPGEQQLFNKKTEWGDKKALISNAYFEDVNGNKKLYFRQGDDLTIKVEYTFYETIENPIFGIVINNSEDQPIFAANTMWSEIRTGTITKGEKRMITFRLHQITIPEDKYYVSPAVASDNGRNIHDWKANWYSFSTKGKQNVGKFYNLPHKITL
jgi:hypothetical protein